jgi:peptide chain release factor 1
MRSGLPATVFDIELIEERPGLIVFRALGDAATKFFANEPGGHRWQRIPPTEKRGRVQTSTVTVAVLPEPSAAEYRIEERDLDYQTCRGSGAGGQHRNMTDSAVQLTHKPTGLMVRCESERSQHQNRATALALLRARLWEAHREKERAARAAERKQQVGIGARGDKRRTIRCQDGAVNDHVTGQRWGLKEYLRGNW